MGDESAVEKALARLREEMKLSEDTGFLKDAETSLKNVNGAAAKLLATFSATQLALKGLEAGTLFFGDLPEQLINFSEQLRKSVAGNEEYVASIPKLKNELLALGDLTAKFGIRSRDNLKILRDLSSENVKMLPIYKENAVRLVEFTARMKAFGVETKESATIINLLTSNLNFTGDQLDKTRLQLVSFANQTGQSVKEVMSSYGQSISKFMDFLNPDEMNKSFMQFQVMARRMGSEAGSLYDMATKFDTIEQSQEIGGRLNQTLSALGIEFSTLALQEMEPDERIRYISDKVKEGLDVAKTMGSREGRLIMRSLQTAGGFNSFAELQALAAEGNMARADAFEFGGLQQIDLGTETERARRENAANVAAAESEQMIVSRMRTSGTFQQLDGIIDDFGGHILKFEEAARGIKEAGAAAAFQQMEQRIGPFLSNFVETVTLQKKLTDQQKTKLGAEGITGVTDIAGVFAELSKKDPATVQNVLKEAAAPMMQALVSALVDALKASGAGKALREG